MKGIIFDCDGVLVDSEPISAKAWVEAFKNHDVFIEEVEMRSFIGNSSKKILAHFTEKTGLPLTEAVLEHNYQAYMKLAGESLEPMPKIEKVLQYLKEAKIPYAVASSSTHERIEFSLNKTKLRTYFDIICSASEVAHAKPAPDLFLLAAERLELNPEECIVIEDSLAGIEGAKAAKMKVYAYASSYDAKELKTHGADFVFRDYDELLKKLGE